MTDNKAANTSGGAISPRMIGAIVAALIALVFVFSNTGQSKLSFLGLHWSMPGWIWFIVLLALGFVSGSLFPWFRKR